MKLPYLRQWDNTNVIVTVTSGINDNGAPNVVVTYTGLCNLREKTKTVRKSDGQYVTLNGSLTIGTDIAPGVEVLAGHVQVNNGTKTWKIDNGVRVRNPDGSINHTKLELI